MSIFSGGGGGLQISGGTVVDLVLRSLRFICSLLFVICNFPLGWGGFENCLDLRS